MNSYLTAELARDRVQTMLTDAAQGRRARSARRARRSAARAIGRAAPAGSANHPSLVTRPFAAVHAWFAAGLL